MKHVYFSIYLCCISCLKLIEILCLKYVTLACSRSYGKISIHLFLNFSTNIAFLSKVVGNNINGANSAGQ